MQEALIEKLHQYIVENNPDLLIALQERGNVSGYIIEKMTGVDLLMHELLAAGTPVYIIAERCMNELTKELRPSKFNFLTSVIEEEFSKDYHRLKESGLLTYEVVNILASCTPVFEAFSFTEEAENNRYLRYAITGVVKEYLENKQ